MPNKSITFLVVFFLVFFSSVTRASARAECSASASTSTFPPSTTGNVTFTVTNTGQTDIVWVKIIVTDPVFTLNDGTSSNWSPNLSEDLMIFLSGSISPGSSDTFVLNLTSDSSEYPAVQFQIDSSDTEEESDAVNCSNNPEIAITLDTLPTISDVSVATITSSTATITWTTAEAATSVVNYGTSSSYGSTVSDTDFSTSHSITLSSLSAGTTYHYKISATDDTDNTYQTGNSTFSTTVGAAVVTSVTVTSNVSPILSINALNQSAFSSSPVITAQATDDNSIAAAQYSIDNGTTWISIPLSSTVSKSVNFSFTPNLSTSGQKTVKVRVRDNSGSFSSIGQLSFTLDNQGPKITCPGDFSKPFLKSPSITCQATDNTEVSSFQYSLDGGNSWHTADAQFTISASVRINFSLPSLDDGSYKILIRAVDSLGNQGKSTEISLIVDRLPPRFGSTLFSTATHTLSPDSKQIIKSISGIDLSVTTSIVGGATKCQLFFKGPELFPPVDLSPTQMANIWSIKFTPPKPGQYSAYFVAVDGASNTTTSTPIDFEFLSPGRIHTDTSSDLTVYFKDPLTNSFSKWDGIGYGISNPQTAVDGQYHLILPAGTYYLTVSSPGYRTLYSHIFTLEKTTPITQDFYPLSQPTIKLGSFHLTLPILPPTEVDLVFNSSADLTFTSLEPETKLVSSLSELKGQPTLLSILNTWSPQTPSQLASLSSLTPKLQKTRIVILVPHESSTQVQTFKNKGNYPFTFIADPDGEYLKDLEYHFSPTTFILNNNAQPIWFLPGLIYPDLFPAELQL